MTKLWRYVFVPALLFASLTSSAQNQVRARDEVKASPVKLLPGYRIQIVRGIESVGGTISKDAGKRIEFQLASADVMETGDAPCPQAATPTTTASAPGRSSTAACASPLGRPTRKRPSQPAP